MTYALLPPYTSLRSTCCWLQGTSMASLYATGVAALIARLGITEPSAVAP